MLKQITQDAFRGHGPIQILYPGLAFPGEDSGIGSIGRIDHAQVRGKQHIGMHPHINDEILSYFRSGKVHHSDSEGYKDTIGKNRLMLMKAGKLFYHEEDIDGETESFEGLQIFIRPGERDLQPEVTFMNLDDEDSVGKWRLLASPTRETSLTFSSRTWLYDTQVPAGETIHLPVLPDTGLTALLYIYQGSVAIDAIGTLGKKEMLIIRDEQVTFHAHQGAELVLFVTDENAPVFKAGMFSGNKIR